MTRYKPEIVLGTILLALFLAVCYWQAPGHVLTKGEIEAYVQRIDQLAPLPAQQKADFIADLRAWGEADDGKPVYMFNLMRYYPQLQPLPGTEVKATSPAEANSIYEGMTMGIALAGGVQMPVGSNVQGVRKGATPSTNLIGHAADVDNWSRLLVVRYPCRRAFFELVGNPECLTKMMPYKFAALHVDLVPTDGATIMPDSRLLLGFGSLVLFLAFGWLRASRRR
ncbi:MAG: hypothetical protein IPJ25_14975 [Rhodocyclaceae bacterium]|nr:hypothetical protein [Rhodocyclaceae bacterium]